MPTKNELLREFGLRPLSSFLEMLAKQAVLPPKLSDDDDDDAPVTDYRICDFIHEQQAYRLISTFEDPETIAVFRITLDQASPGPGVTLMASKAELDAAEEDLNSDDEDSEPPTPSSECTDLEMALMQTVKDNKA